MGIFSKNKKPIEKNISITPRTENYSDEDSDEEDVQEEEDEEIPIEESPFRTTMGKIGNAAGNLAEGIGSAVSSNSGKMQSPPQRTQKIVRPQVRPVQKVKEEQEEPEVQEEQESYAKEEEVKSAFAEVVEKINQVEERLTSLESRLFRRGI